MHNSSLRLPPIEAIRAELERRREIEAEVAPNHALEESLAAIREGDYAGFLRQALPKGWQPDADHIIQICDHLDAMFRGEIDRLAIHLPPRHGKPVHDESIVLMGDGSRKAIKDIVPGDKVVTHRGRPKNVSGVHVQGDLPCVKITTQRGRVTRAALSHPFLTPRGWVAAGSLMPGETLAVVPCPATQPSEESEDLARMAGYFVGDGATGPSSRGKGFNAKITCADQDTADDFTSVAMRVGWGYNVRKGRGEVFDYAFTGGVRDWLRAVGLAFKTSRTKRVPDFVMRGSKTVAAEFIAAYFLCDGTVNARSGRRDDCCVEWCSVNEPLLRDTQHLLLRLGIQATLRSRVQHTVWSPPEGTHSFRLSISTIDDCAKFCDVTRLVGPKARRLEEWNPKRTSFGTPSLAADQVVSVEDAGMLPCRCLTVEDDCTFTSDDLVVHNTESVPARGPVYSLVRNGQSKELLSTYNASFARRLGRKTRNIALGVGLKLSEEKAASDEWETSEGGLVMARGVGSPPTGSGFGHLWFDDLIRRRKDAESETYRNAAWDWYTDDVYTRLEPGGTICVTATLWHHDDVCVRMVASEPGRWTVLKLPAISDDGHALWPERWPLEELIRRRDVMVARQGPRGWEALYQQNPTPREGAFYQVDKIQIVEAVPAMLRKARGWDAAASLDGDFTAGPRLEGPCKDGFFYVTDVVRGRWEPGERDQKIRRTAEFDGPEVMVTMPQDPGAAGKSQGEAWVRLLAGFNVEIVGVTGSKEVRGGPAAAQVNAGNVKMLRGDWNRDFIEELRLFPGGPFDDQCDGFADAFAKLAGSGGSGWDWQ